MLGAIIMFYVLGFVPGWVTAKILNGFGLLRIPRQIEPMGLDAAALAQMRQDEAAIIEAERDALTAAPQT